MWIGEILSEYKWNGISLLILAGIVSAFHRQYLRRLTILPRCSQPIRFTVISVIVIVGVVLQNEGERKSRIIRKQVRGEVYGGASPIPAWLTKRRTDYLRNFHFAFPRLLHNLSQFFTRLIKDE